jgi:acyl-ACP thioesterase
MDNAELVDRPPGGRSFTLTMWPGLGDCAPSGRIRLDALARWLQDVAYADVEDAGLAESAVWVVRRTRMLIRRFPRFAERFEVETFCSGLGKMWAERRTRIAAPTGPDDGEDGDGMRPAIEAVALWVHLDPDSKRPIPFTDAEFEAYGGAAAGRRITARLRHPRPAPGLDGALPWRFRATECDIADHVNNAAYWQPLEEELLARPEQPEELDVEIEFRTPAQPGDKQLLRAGTRMWIVSPEGETHASLAIRG